jgi:hypothetical protein
MPEDPPVALGFGVDRVKSIDQVLKARQLQAAQAAGELDVAFVQQLYEPPVRRREFTIRIRTCLR